MTIQEAIEQAVEEGYHIYGSDGMDTYYEGANRDFSAWTRKDNASSFIVPTEETFLDPHFWQALGRALGWSERCDLAILCGHGEDERQKSRGYYWMYQWHCFIQAIADGNTPEAFFARLASSPTPRTQSACKMRGDGTWAISLCVEDTPSTPESTSQRSCTLCTRHMPLHALQASDPPEKHATDVLLRPILSQRGCCNHECTSKKPHSR